VDNDRAPATALFFSDPYLASSLLQKAIRRGDLVPALKAARALLAFRGPTMWKRLLTIAFEDVGVGSVPTLVMLAGLATSPLARQQFGGETEAVLHAVRCLCGAPKDRSSDYLLSMAQADPNLEATREFCGSKGSDGSLALLADNEQPLSSRAIAAWYCTGLDLHDERRLTGNCRKEMFALMMAEGVPRDLIEATKVAVTITREPIVAMVPLLWLELQQSPAMPRPTSIPPLPPFRIIHGTPSYAFDKHTRIGKRAGGLLALRCDPVAELLSKYVSDYRAKDAARMAAFYVDATPVANRLSWSQSASLEARGMESDMQKVGVDPMGAAAVVACVRANLDQLNAIRFEVAQQAVAEAGLVKK